MRRFSMSKMYDAGMDEGDMTEEELYRQKHPRRHEHYPPPRRQRCPICGDPVADRRSGCGACEVFQCVDCKQWVPWSFGADDDAPDKCDDCWDKANPPDPDTEETN